MGWWSVGKIRGVPIRLHWSALLGGLFFSGFRFAPGSWIGFVLVILVHELGHAAVVKITRQRVHGVTIHGMGGECQWSGNATPIQRSCIAWGGVWGQLALVVLVFPFAGLLTLALGRMGAELVYALTWGSLMLAAINLIPFGPLDGVEAPARKAEVRRAPASAKEEVFPEVRSLMERIAKEARDARRKAN